MIKNIILSAVSTLALTGVAAAADLPSRMAPPVYAPPPLPSFTWTGAYFGVNAGYAFNHQGRFLSNEGLLPTRGQRLSEDGFTAGGQIGYNYQLPGFGGFGGPGSGIVVGVEADAAYTDLDKTRSYVYPADGASLFGTTTTYRTSLDYLGTVRGRVGYAFNQFMIYGTGGFAYGSVNNRTTAVGLASGGTDDFETGYAYGGGIEYALPTNSFLNFFKSSAVTLKAEYLHYDLGRSTYNLVTPAGAIAGSSRVSNDGDLARVGLNFKFGAY